jgi:hypothetical protein
LKESLGSPHIKRVSPQQYKEREEAVGLVILNETMKTLVKIVVLARF